MSPMDGVDPAAVALVAPGGGCLRVQGSGYPGGAGGLVIARCNETDPAQAFSFDVTSKQLKTASGRCVDVHSGGNMRLLLDMIRQSCCLHVLRSCMLQDLSCGFTAVVPDQTTF